MSRDVQYKHLGRPAAESG